VTAAGDSTLRGRIEGNLGQKLIRAARLFDRQAFAALARSGHPIREAHTRLFAHLDFEGIRLTELAARAGITKQSAQQLVDELTAHGYLRRAPDPTDGRAKLILPTPKGLQGVSDGLDALAGVEARLAASVGPRELAALDDALALVLATLEDERGSPR